jgi:hypothetical protein
MAYLPGRTGRRRRVLNEEMLSASTAALPARADQDVDEDAPRYCEAAGVENYPQVTDFVPRRYRSLALLTMTGLASIMVLVALNHWAGVIAQTLGMRTTAPLDFAVPGSLAAWLAAVLMLVTSVACLLVYSIRRHRIDDFRGRYRVWLAAAAACLVLSVNSVAGLHSMLADAASHYSGWWALRDGAVWWLVLVGVPITWVAFRALSDTMECLLAACTLVTAVMAYVGALGSYLGWNPITFDHQFEPLVTVGLTLVGHWMVLVAVAAYARYVVLDAQGLVVHRRNQQRCQEPFLPMTQPRRQEADSVEKVPDTFSPTPRPTKWVDGRRPEPDRYEDDEPDRGGRKLSKSERKQLRKLKAQSRAA